ncbi:MAG: type II toxin-antitoxin system VapC family toxin [Phycisphaerales bacterium]
MIAVDTNILIYAHRTDSVWHEHAAACIRRLAEGTAPWLIPWPCLHEFLAIVTHPRVFKPPSTPEEAVRQADYWLESHSVVVGGESPMHWGTIRACVRAAKITGPLVHDARVAAICIDHEVEALWSADRDFSRFSALRVVNPLVV